MKLRAQVLSDLGSVFFKELHFGVYLCLFSYTSSTKQQKAFEQNTCRDLSVQNFPTPQVKLQGQFKWKQHKFRQIKVILSTIKKKNNPFLFMQEDNSFFKNATAYIRTIRNSSNLC